jgi:hypothetical protein
MVIARDAMYGQSFFNQFLEAQFLQHGRHGKQPAVRRKVFRPEVERRGSRNFIGLWRVCGEALFGAGFLAMLAFVLHHLGDPLEVEFANREVSQTHFYPMFLGSPKWFFQLQSYRSPPQCIIQV